MDQEAQKAIDEALHILQKKTPEGFPVETSTNQQEEEEPTEPSPAIPPPQPLELPQGANETRQEHTRRWPLLLLIMGCSLGVTLVFVLVLFPLFRPVATITIIPSVNRVTATTVVEVQGRTLTALTLTQARTDATTGIGHQDARAARGTVTFYNAAPFLQTVVAGTVLIGRDGRAIITEQDAVIPAGDLATNGQHTVSAHALQVGPAGNIQAGDLYGACCRLNVFVSNGLFTGGQIARRYPMVTQSDVAHATQALQASITESINATFRAQLRQGEANTPPVCHLNTTSDHQAGEEATRVNTSITATCTDAAYQLQDVQTQMQDRLTKATQQQLGDGYALMGTPQITVTKSYLQGTLLTLQITGQGEVAYQFEGKLPGIKAHLAGMKKTQATAWLAHFPGVRAVSIDIDGGDTTTLPQDTNAIHCTILYTS